MTVLWRGIKVWTAFVLILALLATSGVIVAIFYDRYQHSKQMPLALTTPPAIVEATPAPELTPVAHPSSAMITAPLIRQNPELPAGCEITSLAMLLQYAGVNKSKMELNEEVPKDETPIEWNKDGTIKSWGNPNIGYVGDATPKAKGFAIYHKALLPLMQKYVPSSFDLTERPFADYEAQIAQGKPVLIWTTINFMEPTNWVVWDTSIGPIKTTFSEHAVLLVGYDEENVYVNDPYGGKAAYKINKEQFLGSWEALGKQGLSYTQ
ncbi:C39 family peptidase [Paenibacillus sp. N1-5-1-14]|uniref:C39 family peptidase n=1 Tax=Paenibacillus radicibacter TaxID=2972488 RepID=UPI0021591885|nr:C39 family peptidase [Paenibacillus radicibacter]MCR8641847.1 C39 family peptidase [Paenibacillus radicibacter]